MTRVVRSGGARSCFHLRMKDSKMSVNGLRLTLAGLFLALCCLPVTQAEVSASIKGTVTDASGAAVGSATVTIKNSETGAIRGSSSDDGGRYLVLALPVGEYEVRVAKGGFRDAV